MVFTRCIGTYLYSKKCEECLKTSQSCEEGSFFYILSGVQVGLRVVLNPEPETRNPKSLIKSLNLSPKPYILNPNPSKFRPSDFRPSGFRQNPKPTAWSRSLVFWIWGLGLCPKGLGCKSV